MMNARALRRFLLGQPRPTSIRVSTSDGEQQEIKAVGSRLTKVSETLEALRPDLIECLDPDGKLLRALRPEQELLGSDAASIPAGIAADPESLRLTHFANLIHRAYEHSAEIAFSKLLELVERMNDRSDGIEQRLERTESRYRKALEDQIDDALARAEETAQEAAERAAAAAEAGNAGAGDILGALVNGAMAGKVAANGAAKA